MSRSVIVRRKWMDAISSLSQRKCRVPRAARLPVFPALADKQPVPPTLTSYLCCRLWQLPWAIAIATVLAASLGVWRAEAADEPPSFHDVCFEDFDYPTQGFAGVDDLQSLWEPLPGKEGKIVAGQRVAWALTKMTGTLRLKPAWQADSVLRMSIEANESRLRFWNGDRGVELRLYSVWPTAFWSAYGITRSGAGPVPETYAHWAGDNGRYVRSKGGTVEVRCQDGQLVLSRGDLLLLRAPFDGLPTEVDFEGTASVRGMAMLRSGPMPLESPRVQPAVVRADKPADLPWKLTQEPGKPAAELKRLPDGSAELTSPAKSGRTRANALTLAPGLYEFIFEVENPEPGTGIYFAAPDGRDLITLDFLADRPGGRTAFALSQSSSPPQAVSYAGRRQWLRVVIGATVAHCDVSGDGIVWSERWAWRNRVAGGPCTSVGLYTATTDRRTDKRLSLRLRSAEVRRLDAVLSPTRPEVYGRAVFPGDVKDLPDWEKKVAEARPADVPAAEWRRACLLRALSENATALPNDKLLGELAEEAIVRGDDADATLRVLEEVGLLMPVADYRSPLSEYYQRWRNELVRRGRPNAYGTVRNAMLRMPGWTTDTDIFSRELSHRELQGLIQTARWDEVAEFCRQMKYWLRVEEMPSSGFPWAAELGPTVHFLNWGEAQAARYGRKAGPAARSAASNSVRDPLSERLGKESYNVLGEFEAAMETGSYREAAQTICNMSTSQGLGLVSDLKDPQLLVSLPITIARRMQEVPELREALRKHFGSLGQLRQREAIAADDPAAVEAITLQFAGTEAAATAHAWLGDREFSMGRVAQAAGHYREALPDLTAASREEALARLRLAEALMGRDVGQPVTSPVNLGEVRMQPAEFERLVADLREARAKLRDTAGAVQDAAASTSPCAAPGPYRWRYWTRITSREDPIPAGLDRCDRRFAATLSGNQMIVTDQVQQTAIDLRTGAIRWQEKKLFPVPQEKKKEPAGKGAKRKKEKAEEKPKPAGPQFDPRWSLAPMAPVVDRGRVYVRRLTEQQCEMICLDAASGKRLWSGDAVASAVADALLVGPDLFTITAKQPLGGQLDVALAGFDPGSGQMQSQASLADFRDYSNRALQCRAVATENKVIASVGGTVICCELPGRVRWLRRQIFAPPPQIPSPQEFKAALLWYQQTHNPPLVAGDRIYVTQPGVWAVECLNLDNGRLIWRQPLPEITSLAGRIDRRLVVGTADGVLALDAQSGKILWRCEMPDRLEPILCGPPGGILCMRLETANDAKAARRPVLVWLAPETGQVVRECTLEPPSEGAALIGPILVQGDRQWAIFTVPDKPEVRDIVELVAAKSAGE